MSSAQLLFIAFSILSCPVVIYGKVTCLDNNNKPVDWLVDTLCFVRCLHMCQVNFGGKSLPSLPSSAVMGLRWG